MTVMNWRGALAEARNERDAAVARAEAAEAAVERVEKVLANRPLIVSAILRDLELNPVGDGGELHFHPSVEGRGRSGCPGDNLTVWLTEFRAALDGGQP